AGDNNNGWTCRNNKCYTLVRNHQGAFSDSDRYCGQLRGRAVTIYSEDEQRFLENYLRNAGYGKNVWIGGHRENLNFAWHDRMDRMDDQMKQLREQMKEYSDKMKRFEHTMNSLNLQEIERNFTGIASVLQYYSEQLHSFRYELDNRPTTDVDLNIIKREIIDYFQEQL
ncbi:C-type lectin-like protein, partial [Euroglyphus maynei]